MTGYRDVSHRCLERNDYEGYVNNARKQYQQTRADDDKAFYETAQREYDIYKEIQRILNSDSEDYYGIIGVDKTASLAEINKAYRHLICKCHPTKTKVEEATSATQILQKAFSAIGTEEKRKAYDMKCASPSPFAYGAARGRNGQPTMDDIYAMMRHRMWANQFGGFRVHFQDGNEMYTQSPFGSHTFYQGAAPNNIYDVLYQHVRARSRRDNVQHGRSSRLLEYAIVIIFIIVLVIQLDSK